MSQHGFTLLEVMLSVVIMGLLAGLSLPVYESFVRHNDLDLASQQLAATLRRAENYARSVNRDSVWSVEIQPSAITLFQGTNFASRDTAFDEVISLPNSVTASGISEVQFTKVSGAPNVSGSITLSSNTNTTRTISLNAKGTVDY